MRARAIINLSSLSENIAEIKKRLKPQTKLMLIVKANAYGLGAIEIARYAQSIDFVSFLGVATDDEALELRENGITKNILILGYEFSKDYKRLIENDISFCVFDYKSACDISSVAARLGKQARLHIKIDTGMSRIGFFNNTSDLDTVKAISELSNVRLEGIFTHFARADEEDREATLSQLQDFNDCIQRLEDMGLSFELKHCSNSAAIIQYDMANMDMVRSGGLVYGISPDVSLSHKLKGFQPIFSVESTVVFIKTIKKGVQISYGGAYTAKRDMRIATVPVGYADGYPRSLSNKGYVLINGHRCCVVGRVCMDQFMVDVTNLPELQIGDRVVILGQSGDESISIDELAVLSDRLGYELACGLGDRVHRVYVE